MLFRPMPILTGLTVVCLIILMTLGNWQYARYSEKMARPTVSDQSQDRTVISVELDRTLSGNVQQVYGFADSEPVWRRYAPGRVEDTDETVLVMIGATGGAEPVPLAIADLPLGLMFEGFIAEKTASTSAFSGRDNPDEDIWYRLDPEALSAKFGLSAAPRVAEPLMMSVRNSVDASQTRMTLNPYAFAKPVDPLPPERHFGYALTWWGMALGLLGVYVALHHSRGRLRFKKA